MSTNLSHQQQVDREPTQSLLPQTTDPTDPINDNDVMVELTSKCNLRCVYCPKSQPGDELRPGRDQEMEPAVLARFENFLARLAARSTPVRLLLVGTGETTHAEDWRARCAPFLAVPGSKGLISNFARVFTDEDLDCLLAFDAITVSLDTTDPALLKRIRRKVDLRTVTYNVVRLRARSVAKGVACPVLDVNCTLTDQVALGVRDLAIWAATLGMGLVLSSLYEMPDIEGQVAVRCVTAISNDDFNSFLGQIVEVDDMYAGLDPNFRLQPNLKTRIEEHINLLGGAEPTEPSASSTSQTRLCMQPWTRFTLAADGLVYPCCVTTEEVGSLAEGPVEAVLFGEKARSFRRRLLEGDMPAPCRTCSNAPLGSPEELRTMVQQARAQNPHPASDLS